MPGRPARTRVAALTRFQLLWHRVDFDAEDDEVAEALAYVATDADHDLPPLADARYAVRRVHGGWEVEEDGLLLGLERTTVGVLDLVYRRLHQRAYELASLRGWVRLHAATVDLTAADGGVRRVLVAAPSGTGKTSLACRLRLDGVDVPADESVLVRDGVALPAARRFHVKAGAVRAVPDLAPLTHDAPHLRDQGIWAVDPRRMAAGWRVQARPIAAVLLLRRGVARAFEPESALRAMPELLADCFPNQEAVGDVVREIATVLRVAGCHRLTMPAADEPAAEVAAAAVLLRAWADGMVGIDHGE